MKLSEFDYDLPESQIAQNPLEKRDESKLMVLDKHKKQRDHKVFKDIIKELGENDVLVLNKTRVINARLSGYNDRCEHIEVFLHKKLEEDFWECIVFPGKKLKPGAEIFFKNKKGEKISLVGKVEEICEIGRNIRFNIAGNEFLEIIEECGNIPLPPYIKEKLENSERYQTVFNEIAGSVAAPTAGLHFTPELINALKEKGVKIEKVLLHVGAGTFKGVQTEDIKNHKMHSEYIELSEETAKKLNEYKKNGKRIIAVGTTSIRVLETFTNDSGELVSGKTNTDIFIYPGYEWKFVDSIITNFHLPKSTLIMLVSSFAGKDFIMDSYKEAVEKNYRFFSFGDSMWIK